VAFSPIDFRHHANVADVLLQFGLGLLNVYLQDLTDVAKPPGSELANASDLCRNGIRFRREQLVASMNGLWPSLLWGCRGSTGPVRSDSGACVRLQRPSWRVLAW
jgi:hypothetical protein